MHVEELALTLIVLIKEHVARGGADMKIVERQSHG
jgi:hypothetical protein